MQFSWDSLTVISHLRQVCLAKVGWNSSPLPLPPLLELSQCLSDLVLTYRPIIALPEYDLKVVSICKLYGSGGLAVVVLRAFHHISAICKIMRKSDEKVL